MSSILMSTEWSSSSSCILTSLYSSSFSSPSEMSPNSKLNFLLRALLEVARRTGAGASQEAFFFELDSNPMLGSKSIVSKLLFYGV
jgi:hypothetical protein